MGCKWLFKIKLQADGGLDRYKASLVVKGYSQEKGVHFLGTFGSLIKYSSIRIILSLATMMDWSVVQLDVKNAFLDGGLDTKVFMELPQGFLNPNVPNYVCKLHKSLYETRSKSLFPKN